jgi:hypothetical protein
MEIQLQLTLMFGEEPAQRGFQRHIAFELRGELLDRREVGEAVEPFAGGVGGGPDQPPSFQVAEMVVRDPGIEASNIAGAVELPAQRVFGRGRRH